MPDTRSHFHQDLARVCEDVVRLGALAVAAIERGTDAFLDGDLVASDAVAADDRALDDLMHSIEDRTYSLLALQQPMAGDLRTLVTVLRIIHELERVGDLVVNIVQATHRLSATPLSAVHRGIIDRMRAQAVRQLQIAVTAVAERDPTKGPELNELDDVMDDLQRELFRAIFTEPAQGEAQMQRAVQVALISRYYERIADHAVTTAERVAYMVRGSAHPSVLGSNMP